MDASFFKSSVCIFQFCVSWPILYMKQKIVHQMTNVDSQHQPDKRDKNAWASDSNKIQNLDRVPKKFTEFCIVVILLGGNLYLFSLET